MPTADDERRHPGSGDAREALGRLPARLAGVVRPSLPDISDEVVDAIRSDVAVYRRPLGGALGRAVRRGVELSLAQFVDLVEDPDRPERGETAIRELGRGEMRAGRTLDALQAAYRTGARVSWRRFGDLARADGADGAVLIALGEAIFAYVDRLAGLSVAGYAEEQSLRAGAAQRSRDRVVRLALADPSPDPDELAQAVATLGWSPPGHVAALVLPGRDDPGDVLRVDPSLVAAAHRDAVVAFVGTSALDRVARSFMDADAALGPTVPWAAVRASHARARSVLALRDAGRLTPAPGGLVRTDAHLAALVVHADPGSADDLATAVLAGLDALPPGRRARLVETLRAWLDHRGHGPGMAAALHLHPQTVRYRVARLREALGVDLDDPEARFALEVGLRRRGERRARPPADAGSDAALGADAGQG